MMLRTHTAFRATDVYGKVHGIRYTFPASKCTASGGESIRRHRYTAVRNWRKEMIPKFEKVDTCVFKEWKGAMKSFHYVSRRRNVNRIHNGQKEYYRGYLIFDV